MNRDLRNESLYRHRWAHLLAEAAPPPPPLAPQRCSKPLPWWARELAEWGAASGADVIDVDAFFRDCRTL